MILCRVAALLKIHEIFNPSLKHPGKQATVFLYIRTYYY
jgi:hypothetical protein